MKKFTETLLQKLARVTTGGQYLPEIDGLRFLAILLVAVQHLSERLLRHGALGEQGYGTSDAAFWASRGTVGVFIFFALSGFMLSLPFARYHLGLHLQRPSLRRYALRRISRLEPPYLFWMLIFTLVLSVKGYHGEGSLFTHLLASMGYQHGLWYQSFSPSNPVAWSLEVEIQFYVLAPLLAKAYFSISHSLLRRSVLATFLVMFIGFQQLFGWLELPFKLTLLAHLQHFLVGFFLADLWLTEKKHWRPALHFDGLAALSLIGLMLLWSAEYSKSLLFTPLLGLLLYSVFNGVWVRKLLTNPWVLATGGMCYTIYLIHLPLLEALVPWAAAWQISSTYGWQLLFQAVLLLPLIWAVSAIAFLLMEKPFMQPRWYQAWLRPWRRHSQKPKFTLKVFGMVLLLGTVSSLETSAQNTTVNDLELRPLDSLLSHAVGHSPLLKSREAMILAAEADIRIEARRWMDFINVGAAATYGSGSLLDLTNDGTLTAYQLKNRRNVLYNTGVTLRVSPSDILNRKDRTRQKRLEIQAAQHELRAAEDEIRASVIELYQALQQTMDQLAVQAASLGALKLAYEEAERYFKGGQLSAVDYSRTSESYFGALERFKVTENEVKTGIWLLREVCSTEVLKRPAGSLED